MTPPDLRAILRTLGLTHAQAAGLCGVHENTVAQWCQGRRANPAAARLLWLMVHHRDAMSIRSMLNWYPNVTLLDD